MFRASRRETRLVRGSRTAAAGGSGFSYQPVEDWVLAAEHFGVPLDADDWFVVELDGFDAPVVITADDPDAVT